MKCLEFGNVKHIRHHNQLIIGFYTCYYLITSSIHLKLKICGLKLFLACYRAKCHARALAITMFDNWPTYKTLNTNKKGHTLTVFLPEENKCKLTN